jgi:MFS family permease
MSSFSPQLIILYLGRLVSVCGDWVYMIALSLLLAKNHGVELTILWIIRTLSPILIRFFAGTIVDSLGPKKTVVLTDIARGLLVALIPFTIGTWYLFILVFLVSALGPFYPASMNPIITNLVSEENRHRVNSNLSIIVSLALFVGPMLGGLLVQFNYSIPFYTQAATYIFSAITLIFIKAPPKSYQNYHNFFNFKVIRNDLVDTIKIIFKNAKIKYITFSSAFFLLGGAAIDAYEVLFITKGLGFGSTEYALFVSVSGISFLVGGFVNSIVAKKFQLDTLLTIGLIVAVLSNIVFAISINFYMITISTFLLGIGLTTFNTSVVTILQNSIPTEKQGRLTSIQSVFPETASVLSVLLSGSLIPFLPIRYIILGFSFITLLSLIPLFIYRKQKIPQTNYQVES